MRRNNRNRSWKRALAPAATVALRDVAEICIKGMREHAAELNLQGTGE